MSLWVIREKKPEYEWRSGATGRRFHARPMTRCEYYESVLSSAAASGTPKGPDTSGIDPKTKGYAVDEVGDPMNTGFWTYVRWVDKAEFKLIFKPIIPHSGDPVVPKMPKTPEKPAIKPLNIRLPEAFAKCEAGRTNTLVSLVFFCLAAHSQVQWALFCFGLLLSASLASWYANVKVRNHLIKLVLEGQHGRIPL